MCREIGIEGRTAVWLNEQELLYGCSRKEAWIVRMSAGRGWDSLSQGRRGPSSV